MSTEQREVVIIEAVRTPQGHHKGPTKYIRSDELLAIV